MLYLSGEGEGEGEGEGGGSVPRYKASAIKPYLFQHLLELVRLLH